MKPFLYFKREAQHDDRSDVNRTGMAQLKFALAEIVLRSFNLKPQPSNCINLELHRISTGNNFLQSTRAIFPLVLL